MPCVHGTGMQAAAAARDHPDDLCFTAIVTIVSYWGLIDGVCAHIWSKWSYAEMLQPRAGGPTAGAAPPVRLLTSAAAPSSAPRSRS